MKKVLCLFLLWGLLFVSCDVYADNQYSSYINKNGLVIYIDEYERLLNLGFTDEQIFFMDEEEFNRNKNLVGTVVAQTSKYYKSTIYYYDKIGDQFLELDNPIVIDEEITKEEYDSVSEETNDRGLHNGDVETTYKHLTSTIIAVNNRYRLKANMDWKKIPKIRSYDIFAIGIDSTVSGIPETKYFKQNWRIDNPCAGMCESHSSTTCSWKTGSAGYGTTFKIPSNSSCTIAGSDPFHNTTLGMEVTYMNSYLYFEINKLTSPINTINNYADYAHATKSVTSSFSLGFSIGLTGGTVGITLTSTMQPKYDSMDTAQAYWSGLNW